MKLFWFMSLHMHEKHNFFIPLTLCVCINTLLKYGDRKYRIIINNVKKNLKKLSFSNNNSYTVADFMCMVEFLLHKK